VAVPLRSHKRGDARPAGADDATVGRVDPLLGSFSIAGLRHKRSVKWTKHPPEVLPAFVAEMDFDIADEIKEAVIKAVRDGDCGYPGTFGPGEAHAKWCQESYRWAPSPEHVFAIPDVMTGVAEILLATTSAGAGVVINPPVYPPFFFRTESLGRHIVEAPLARREDAGYDLDFAVLDEALARRDVEAYILCNPHNPLGRAWSRTDLLQVAELCHKHHKVLIVDEIHAPLVLEGAVHVPFGSLPHEMAREAWVLTSASKGWNIPGLKCGLAVAGTAEGAALLESRWEALLASHIGVLATIAAYSQAGGWLSAVNRQLAVNRRLLSTARHKYSDVTTLTQLGACGNVLAPREGEPSDQEEPLCSGVDGRAAP
jgi:cystathionine beta-lyase